VVSGGNAQFESLENTFHQDLNRDGVIGSPTFDITVKYSGDSHYQSYFTAAAQRWQQVITAALPDVTSPTYGFIDDVLIDVNVHYIDGVNNILGQAGPDASALRSGSFLPYHGTVELDSADLAIMESNGTLFSVILHEMGHVLGIGSMWSYFGLRSGSQYTGAGGVNAYHQLGGQAPPYRSKPATARARHSSIGQRPCSAPS